MLSQKSFLLRLRYHVHSLPIKQTYIVGMALEFALAICDIEEGKDFRNQVLACVPQRGRRPMLVWRWNSILGHWLLASPRAHVRATSGQTLPRRLKRIKEPRYAYSQNHGHSPYDS